MGHSNFARVDTAALITVADRFDDAAASLERAARSRLTFDGAYAGLAHTGQGDEVRRRLEGLLVDLQGWARASAEIGVALRVGARRYLEADDAAATGLGS
ncbi:hypothetical protein BVC93_03585 [Mycobacterium sp. MS1601]|uniref:type VII secretion target n=1 Tax=Mycobacterium sp. MS1601 TaxID=1936029 RepID=UPI0009790B99|nr:type VII secretion target [Mycobacterium sp. MS1601]AQA01662.1 hypothetical protein BVC93_03585 [Mycobacterium sp. MS1601]